MSQTQGRGPRAKTGKAHKPPGARPQWLRRTARCMAALMLCQTLLPAMPAFAQLTPYASAQAGQRPFIDAARNGVPIAHIAPPSAGGVSRNQYDQFNVNANGLILNNSATPTQTQQGGWISGNPQLGPIPARIILNEVLGASASQLRGTIEVVIPRTFEMELPNGQRIWVAGNATEHLAELASSKAVNFTPEAVRLATQLNLAELQAAVNVATQNGVTYGELLTVGRWELKFAPPRQQGQLPALIHAQPK